MKNKRATKKCIKSLRKSTYRGYAFTKGKEYEVVSVEKEFTWIKDNKGHHFNLANKDNCSQYYLIGDYFKD